MPSASAVLDSKPSIETDRKDKVLIEQTVKDRPFYIYYLNCFYLYKGLAFWRHTLQLVVEIV